MAVLAVKAIETEAKAVGLFTAQAAERFWRMTYGPFSIPQNLFSFGSHSKSVGGLTDMTDIHIQYPDDWGFDSALNMTLRLRIFLGMTGAGVDFLSSTVQFKTDGETSFQINATGSDSGWITKTYSALPTGATTETLEYQLALDIGATGSVTVDKAIDDADPDAHDCMFEFLTTS